MAHVIVPRINAVQSRRAGQFGFYDGLDRVFDALWRGFDCTAAGSPTGGVIAPRVDFSETGDEIRVAAELPGLEEKDIEVALNDGVLTIKGERRDERVEGEEAKSFHHVESWRGSFKRSIRLPAEIDEDKVNAVYKAGVLTVTLPKRAQPEPEIRTIPITSA
jgi:HSP20 family protein